jgi:hypothetical protein
MTEQLDIQDHFPSEMHEVDDAPETIQIRGRLLTERQREILAAMRDAEEAGDDRNAEIAVSGASALMGADEIGIRALIALLQARAVSECRGSSETRYYRINATGRKLV